MNSHVNIWQYVSIETYKQTPILSSFINECIESGDCVRLRPFGCRVQVYYLGVPSTIAHLLHVDDLFAVHFHAQLPLCRQTISHAFANQSIYLPKSYCFHFNGYFIYIVSTVGLCSIIWSFWEFIGIVLYKYILLLLYFYSYLLSYRR